MFVAAVKKLGATSIGGRPKHIEGGLGVKKQSAHGVTTMPNLIWPWSIFYFKDQLHTKENKEFLRVFFFWNWIFKIN